jgi:hypothetical protein
VALVSVRLKGHYGSLDIVIGGEDIYEAAEVKALGDNAQEGEGIATRRVQCVFSRAPAGSVEDVAVCSLDFMNMTSGEPDDTWTAGDFGTMEGLLTTFWSAVASYQCTTTVLSSFRWYRIGPGIPKPNPAVRVQTAAVSGTVSQYLPPQLAISVTEKTGIQKRWGRFYIPGLAYSSSLVASTTGRIASTGLTAIHTAALALYDGAAAADFLPVVYSPTVQKVYGVEKVQVDDLFDVQRPRRWDKPLTRLVGNVGP